MRDRWFVFAWFLLLPLLPACSLVPLQQQTLEGFPPDTVQRVRQQSAELEQLQKREVATPAQYQQIRQLRSSVQQFERDVIHTASGMERQDNWHGAEQLLQGATRVLPDSQVLASAHNNFAERRQLREERVRMELAIHRGEQLLKDAGAYEHLRQLQGPDPLTWLELKNYQRECRESAQSLQQHAQRALERKDYALAQHGLKIAQRLYGDDLQQDTDLRDSLQRNLTLANRQLRPAKPRPAGTSHRDDRAPVAELQQALDAGDLPSARQHLDQLRQQSPQDPRLLSLQSQFQTQVSNRVDGAIKRGNDLYSQGEIEQALEVWLEARTLDPDNVELLANIARAEKVLENLRALSPPLPDELNAHP
ncbi:tetratricopeptide repeat protein [uncultured Microbulbifer sp.]|uniref:tetratricopeptide repeat protein n=1 Tax=uncultured Microbulbifer sp. TaxID=348147 RepID=UPI0025F7078B|nr:tetratricopeptide repeat protein [uncultured Microbulbifer sp.]